MDRHAPQVLLLFKFDDLGLPILLAAGLLIVYVAILRPMRARKKDPLARTPQQPSLAQQRAIERDLSALLAQLTATAGEMTSQIEAQAVRLQALLREADEKINELRSATSAASRPPAPRDNVDHIPATAAVDPQHVEIYGLADQGRSPREIARRLNRPHGEVELILALRETK